MRARSNGSAKRQLRLWTAALVLGAGGALPGAAFAQDDHFFTDLDKAGPAPAKPVAPAAAAVDPLGPGALLERGLKPEDTTGALGPRPTIDAAEWTPDHAARASAPVASRRKGDGADAGPDDEVVVPPSGSMPSADPLDRAPVAAPAVVEALPPLAAALKAALDARDNQEIKGPGTREKRKEREAIAFFYAAHGFAPAWSADGRPIEAVASVLGRLARAGEDALTLPASVPPSLNAEGSPEAIAAADIALTELVVAYARQASGARVDPHAISPLIGLLPVLADPGEVIDTLVAAGALAGDKLQALNPIEPRYAALRGKLASLRGKRTPSVGKPIPAGPVLRIGRSDKRVPLLRARLGLAAEPDDLTYDSQLAEAVADFQRANGLPSSGTLDKRTVDAFSGAQPSRLEGTIIANMELWRWMPRDLGADRIEVDVPEYLVRVFHDGAEVDAHRVVVGKTDTPTPLFSNAMKYLIVNPYWNVPQSIIKKEMLPKGGGSLAYLEGRGYDVGYRGGVATVRQLPGPKNALGQIKFLFPNDYSVYLHDTPSKALFSASKRAFSHGCVRVDKPFGFAESVLNDVASEGTRSKWNQDKLQDLVGEKERYINLKTPLPIHIEYFTASVDADGGRVSLREDVYGYAHAVATALGQDSEPVPVAKPKPPAEVADRAPAVRARRKAVAAAEPLEAPVATAEPRTFWGSLFDPR